jgi:2-acylglycerol O-acyltransferase 2
MPKDKTITENESEQEEEDDAMAKAADYAAPLVGHVSFGSDSKRRRQTMAMFSCSLYFIMPMVLGCWIFVIILLGVSRWTSIPVACYVGYAFSLDKAPTNGLRRPWLRSFRSWWNHACDYLPLLLVKTADLDPKKKYVLGYHPHGIISVGCFCAFATDGANTLSLVKKDCKSKQEKGSDATTVTADDDSNRGFSKLFPGIDRRVITLPQNFATPFLREYFLSMGACDSAKETFRSILKRDGTAVVVVVGGAAESMLVQNRSIDLVLERRRGFVREAIRGNACLVPVIGFGESDLYQVYHPQAGPDGKVPWIGRFQLMVKKVTGFAMPLFQGRSIFLKDVGVMPQRTPVCVIVGTPIEPPTAAYWRSECKDGEAAREPTSFSPLVDRKADKPLNKDAEILFEWHAKYTKALKDLHHEHEDAKWNKPGQKRRASLNIVK